MNAKVTVIGAGIAGSSAAFALARRGADVTIIDDQAVGQATAASAGIISPWGSSVEGPFYTAYAAGGNYYPTLLEQLAEIDITKTDYRRTGSLIVHEDFNRLDDAEARVRPRVQEAGAAAGQVYRLDPGEAREILPALAPDLSAVLITGGGRVDGRTLRDALLAGAAHYGARRRTGHAQLHADGGRVRVTVDGIDQPGDAVVVASGAWSNELLAPTGAHLPVAPQRGQITHLRLEGVDTSAWPTINPLSDHYVVAFDDGRVAIGATRETGTGFDPRVTATGQLHVLRNGLSVVPGLAEATFLETRVGLRPLPENKLPVVGALPGHESTWIATGYGAAGLTMGPLLGDAIARSVLGQSAPELDLLVEP